MTAPLRHPIAHPPHALSRTILGAALIIAVAGDLLLRGGDPRLGFTLFIAIVTAGAFVIGDRTDRQRTLLLAGTFVATLGFILRDAQELYPIDVLSVLCMGALTVWRGSGRSVARLAMLDAPKAAILAALTAIAGAPDVIRGVGHADADEAERAERARRSRALAIGVALALPPLLLVMALLSSADSVFGSFVSTVGDFLAKDAVQHVVVILALAWLSMGWLSGSLRGSAIVEIPDVDSPGLPFASASIGLYGLVVLLALFLGLQLRVLFGGAAYLSATAGLTVAEYARQGFFQLVVVAGIVLVTLVVADWLVARTDDAIRRYRAAGIVLVGLVLALLVSAVVRMWLYVSSFGLTMDRVVATAIMAWVVAALVAFAATILRGRGERLAPALLGITIGCVALFNAVNPEAIVVRTNVARAVAGAEFDAAYHATLSLDAFPALRAAAPTLAAKDCAALSERLATAWAARRVARDDWRTWSLPYARATSASAEEPTLSCAR